MTLAPITIPDDLARQGAELIAWASTENAGIVARTLGRDRWTEIAVMYLHAPIEGSRRWVSQVAGMSRIEGETPRVTRLKVGTLERALKLIEVGGPIGVAVAETARQWAEENRVTIERDRSPRVLSFECDSDALAWLYGQPDEGHTGFAKMLARDTGAGESAIRMQVREGRNVMVPLRSLLPFIDRAAFRRARAAGEVR